MLLIYPAYNRNEEFAFSVSRIGSTAFCIVFEENPKIVNLLLNYSINELKVLAASFQG